MKITDDMLTEPPVDPLAPRVEAVIKEVMGRFPGLGKASQAAYYEEVHQHLAPLARTLERENGELRAEIDRLNATIRDQFTDRRTTPDREAIEAALREMQGAMSPYSMQRECHVFDMTMALAINILHRAIKSALNVPTPRQLAALDRLAENAQELGLYDLPTAPNGEKK